MSKAVAWLRSHATAVSVTLLALLAYIPALTAAPGRMPSDSKLYVYLDPGRFISDTTTTFDPRQFAGWVPHQHIAYLWPTGPWFWFFEQLGVPDWVAHRLWIGTLLVSAGLGVRWLARLLGLAPAAALVAALVYQLSPYILPYISRTSVLLLPWAGLGWIVGLTVLAAARGRWRFAAAVALIVFTVGAVNATALAMIIPAPLLWLFHAVWLGSISWRRALATAAKIALLSTAVSLWWLAMLVIQGRYGADVLAYSESLASVSFTSTTTEVVRGLGYWLFYIRDSFGATTTASLDYLVSVRVVIFGFLLLGFCLLGLIVTSWTHRRFAALLFGAGAILAVGAHPIDDPSPLMDVLVGDGEGGLALTLRSSTRAIPVMLLGLALGAGALTSAAQHLSRPLRIGRLNLQLGSVLAVVIGLLAVMNLPALRNGGFVDPQLERDQDPPAAWVAAASRLDDLPDGYRVLQLPGSEFGAFQWGYTVDQPLPALTERPLVTRDLLPLGSPAAMDLVFALDDRFQDGVAGVEALAPVARLLGVDTIWIVGDIDFERFRLARPEIVDALLTGPAAQGAGLRPVERFGVPVVMGSQVEMIDETSISSPLIGQPLSTVALVGIADPVPTVRVKDTTVVLSGSGDGIIDAATAGVIDGSELILYSASLDETELVDALSLAEQLVVTDSNRDRAHHWRSSQDVAGFTESGGPEPDVIRFESGDQRLPVFDSSDASTQTVALQIGPVIAAASAYGEPFAYLPEHRPVMAIDGDPTTSWVVADRAPAVGEFIQLSIAEPIDHITLQQPATIDGARSVTSVRIDIDDREPFVVTLNEESLDGNQQRFDIDPTSGPSLLRITIESTSDLQPPTGEALGAVGFAEILVGLEPTVEVVRPPQDGLDAAAATPQVPVALVFTRLRTDPKDRWRSDPEPTLVREFDLSTSGQFDASFTLRMDQRLTGQQLTNVLRETATDNGHLTGVPAARGAAALDGDPETSWITPFDRVQGSTLSAVSSGLVSTVQVTQAAGNFSPITRLRLTDAIGDIDVEVPLGQATTSIDLPREFDLDAFRVEILEVEETLIRDRRFGEAVVLPAAVSEMTFDGLSLDIRPQQTLAAQCQTGLVELDGDPVPVSFLIDTSDALNGESFEAQPCEEMAELDIGRHLVSTTAGAVSAFNIDQVVFAQRVESGALDAPIDPTAQVVTKTGRRSRTVEVPPCPNGCWVVLGEGFNTAWSANTPDESLGAPQLVDGNANGWWIKPTSAPTKVEIEWTAQRPLTFALGASALAVIALVVLVMADRRREDDSNFIGWPPTPPRLDKMWPRRSALFTAATAVVASALLVGWQWALPALAAAGVALLVRRSRVLGLLGGAMIITAGAVVAYVVRAERTFPGAGWPIRFEWLHGWTLLGIILITCSALWPRDAKRKTT
jgi:arabinofuranan 3-O-arabinosyltransferase